MSREIKVLKSFQNDDQKYSEGDVVEVRDNIAEQAIDKGFAMENIGTEEESPSIGPLDEDSNEKNTNTPNQSRQKNQSSKGNEFTAEVKPGGLPEGEHQGTIIDMEKREVDVGKDESATYLDLIIDVPNQDGRGKVGYNFYITHNSELGKLLKRFGCNLDVGRNIDIQKILMETPIKFYVQENEDGYSEIKKDTVKPIEKGGGGS